VSEWDRFTLETERLRLEPLTLAHVDLVFDLDSDPEVMRYINGGKPDTREHVEEIIRMRSGYRWAAWLHADRDFVGWFGMKPASDRTYDLGYRLRRKYWGVGLATEGSRLLIDIAFTKLDATRVRADTMTVNDRSRRVMEACGLRYVRTYFDEAYEPIEGSDAGDVEYELSRDDYVRAQPS
jgi:RimJ/RimL family protein N-acetyltransferase